jgi:hypothetical protein
VNAVNGTATSANPAAPASPATTNAVLTATLNWTAGNGASPDRALALAADGFADNAGIAGIGTITAAGIAAWGTGTTTATNSTPANGTRHYANAVNGTAANANAYAANGSRRNGSPANATGTSGTPANGSAINSAINAAATSGNAANGRAANGNATMGTSALVPVVITTASEAMTELEAALAARGFGRMLVRAEDHAADMAVLSVCNGITVWCAGGAACLRAPGIDGIDNRRWAYGDLIELAEQVVEAYETMAGGFAVPRPAGVSRVGA